MKDGQYRTFLVSYRHEGATWTCDLKARDLDDARARMARLAFATLDGELKMRIPVASGRIAQLGATAAQAVARLAALVKLAT